MDNHMSPLSPKVMFAHTYIHTHTMETGYSAVKMYASPSDVKIPTSENETF